MSGDIAAADERVRAEIRERVDVNMCVEAGAGTGKTTVLVDRIVRILASGHAAVQNVAVITFTEKAAAELAARVRQGLDDALDASGDEAERGRLEEAVRGLNLAHIETIHAFAAGILRERPVEAELDPGFEVLDELPAQLAFDAAYDEWLTAEMTAEPPPAPLIEALDAGLEFRLVREAAEILHRQRDLLPLPAYDAPEADVQAALDEIGGALDPVRGLAPRPRFEHDQAYQALLETCDTFDALQELRASEHALRRAIATWPFPVFSRGNQTNWQDTADCRRVKDALTRARRAVRRCTAELRGAATARLLRWLEGFVAYYGRKRRAEGKADFEDLLIWARNLVRDRPDVRAYFQEKYRCILVDEFQDTDPLQAELIVYLCEDGQGEADWRHAKLRPGSLFIVGDPKQSIYRFRRADISMYDAVKRNLFGGQVREIVQNFRSVEPIIGWVNRTFAQLISEVPGVQPRYIDLAALPDAGGDGRAVEVVRGRVPGKAAPADLRRAEAEALAALIAREVEGGTWPVRDGDGGATRPAGYRDVAVLVPNRTDLYLYEEALARAGVPHRHEGGRSFFVRQEVRELVALLRAIDDPSDAVAAVAALRSSAFGCSDEELLAHRLSGGGFDHARVKPDVAGAVAGALRALHEFARTRYDRPLPELVRAVIDSTRLVEFAMLQPQGEQIAANLLKVIDQARAFAEAGGGGLRAFVRWLKENVARGSDETDAAISEETDDVVRILTVHASKGLEFPVVVFANMNARRADRTTVIADRSGSGRLHLQLGKKDDGFRTPGYELAEPHEKAHAEAEEVRLLYVAATRAKDRLIVPLFDSDEDARWRDGAPSLADRLRQGGAEGGDGIDAETLPSLPEELPVWRRKRAAAAEADVRRVIEEREAWRAARELRIGEAAAGLRVVTASALKPEWEEALSHDAEQVRRTGATDFGVAVHALLERIDLARPDGVPPLSRAVADEFGLRGREAEIERAARRVLASDAIARALRSRRLLRETPFAVPVERAGAAPGIAEGRIDLLFEEDDAIVIVDFKTDVVSAADVEQRAAMYRNQALVYAWSAYRATGMAVREVIFLFARAGVEHRIPVDAALMAEAESLLRSAVEAGAGAELPA